MRHGVRDRSRVSSAAVSTGSTGASRSIARLHA